MFDQLDVYNNEDDENFIIAWQKHLSRNYENHKRSFKYERFESDTKSCKQIYELAQEQKGPT